LQRVLRFLAQVEEGDIDGAIEQVNAIFPLTNHFRCFSLLDLASRGS
jgi:hypothetical protein